MSYHRSYQILTVVYSGPRPARPKDNPRIRKIIRVEEGFTFEEAKSICFARNLKRIREERLGQWSVPAPPGCAKAA